MIFCAKTTININMLNTKNVKKTKSKPTFYRERPSNVRFSTKRKKKLILKWCFYQRTVAKLLVVCVSKRNVTNLELVDEVTDESEVLDALFRVASSVFWFAACSCSLRAWFCCCSFSQLTRALCSARSSSKGFRRPGTARLSDRACVWNEYF